MTTSNDKHDQKQALTHERAQLPITRLMLSKEDKAKLFPILRRMEDSPYPSPDARRLAADVCAIFRVLFGEFQTKGRLAEQHAPAGPPVLHVSAGAPQVLPHGAQRTYSEVTDAQGRVTHRVIDGVDHEIDPETGEDLFERSRNEAATLMREHGEAEE